MADTNDNLQAQPSDFDPTSPDVSTRKLLTWLSGLQEKLNIRKDAAIVAKEYEEATRLLDQANAIERAKSAILEAIRLK